MAIDLILEAAKAAARTRSAARRDGVIAIVLALVVAFLFPASATAGTETPTLRYLTAGALLLSGLVMRCAPTKPAALVAGLCVLVAAVPVVHATWTAFLALLFAVDLAVAAALDAVRGPRTTHVHDGPGERESATDIIESIATAFILALVVREFAFEAFKIPTGSMETTIYGEGYGRRQGDRLLASKAPLLFSEPDRWEIIVFKYPLFRPTNYIKRLIGLPGEHVENRGGDIYVNGKIVAKPEPVQESLWKALWPPEGARWNEDDDGVDPPFTSDGVGQWSFRRDSATGTAPAGKTGWTIRDTGVTDVRASFDVDASGLGAEGAVLVRLEGGGRRVELEARRDGMWLTAPGIVGAEGPGKRKLEVDGLGSSTVRLGFAVADRVVRVFRNGRVVARVETADETNMEGRGDRASIGVSDGTAKFSNIKLERDLQYFQQGPTGSWHVPPGCYFMLGDNTEHSRDSRLWQGKVFGLTNGGEIVADYHDVRLDDETSVSSSRDLGDAYEVLDTYGVKRRIPKSEIKGGKFNVEYRPFVKREDLVGRAFLIFFPFPPAGEWRPRILP